MRMVSTQGLDSYLSRFRLRLKQLTVARGIATIAVCALLITVVAVTVAIRSGFPDTFVIVSRLLLFAALIFIAWRYIVLPNRRIETDGADAVERRTPDFRGRVETYVGMADADNPMRELLAEDTMAIAGRHPPEQQVRQREFSWPLLAASSALAILVWLAVAGPGNYAYGVRHLWAGWAIPGMRAPLSIEVMPGDDGIRKGGSVRVRATMQGFDPAEAWVHARFGDGEWQRVAMSEEADEFRFTFFSVRETLEYYVSTANVRSQSYQVQVVDLPSVENLSLTYRFPEWTRREPETHDPGGDVRAVVETEVELAITSDGPMTSGALVVDSQEIPLQVDGSSATASFTVERDGQYYVAAEVGGERIRLTDDYFITVLEDEAPEIRFLRPGRDWSASSIEEVTAQIEASDDYAIESLELRYSVNGGDWLTVELPAEDRVAEADHVFFLESLPGDAIGTPLVPGDLISYFAVATDRESESATDIFFVDVQPFDRRYSQSQQMGGMPGQANQQDEISKRQREIIVSTWNLIREQSSSEQRNDDAYVADNAALLSRVQLTLKQQVETLAQRAEARQLVSSDEKIAEFVENLDKAAAAMDPAAERLAELELEQAILPEQEALQYLLRAEAVFTDITVSLQANNRGAGGGNAGRDLSEMFELEMDLEKNQYETGSTATPDAPDQQFEEVANELEELARRQERLAENLNRTSTPTPAQRWQQEMLRRELEELRERLERMQQQSASQQQQQAERQGQSQGQPQPGQPQQGQPQQADNQQPGQPGQGGQSGGQPPQSDELRRRMDSALRAMDEAQRAMEQGAALEELQERAAEAQRQLEGARDRAAEEQREALQAALGDLTERAGEMHDEQAAMEDRLQEAIRGALLDSGNQDRLESGLTYQEENELADRKRELRERLLDLEQDARRIAQQIRDGQPRASEQLEQAVDSLRETDAEVRLNLSAAYIEQGDAIYVAGSESAITEALREFEQDLRAAENMTGGQQDGQPGEGQRGSSLEQTLAETQSLRRALQQLAEGNTAEGPVTQWGRDDLQRSTGVRVDDLEMRADLERRIDNTSEDVIAMFRELRAVGVPVQEIDELRRLASEVRAADFSGNESLLRQESQKALSLVEQIELKLQRATDRGDGNVRATPAENVPDAHKETVAEYYRRLGETDDEEE